MPENTALNRDDPACPAGPGASGPGPRRPRADAQRNIDALLEAARTVFRTSGVHAPAKEIADLAGVGVGTLYRHFPRRSDLVTAVFQRGVDACADAGPALSATHEPGTALAMWLQRYTEFVATKRGLAAALHSGDPAFDSLPGYFMARLEPVLRVTAGRRDRQWRDPDRHRPPGSPVRGGRSVPARARRGRGLQPAHGRAALRRAALRRRYEPVPPLKSAAGPARSASLNFRVRSGRRWGRGTGPHLDGHDEDGQDGHPDGREK